MATVTGTAQALSGKIHDAASLTVALRGYGSQIPRVNNSALFAEIEKEVSISATDGTFTFTVSGNDAIKPNGTYYTVAILDGNGDTLQVNAYRFAGDGDYDLNDIDPIDPTGPPPAPMPPIINELLIVPWSPAPDFDGSVYSAFQITLTADIVGAYLSGFVPGNLYTFIIIQDAVGGHYFQWPSGPPPFGMFNTTPVMRDPNSRTVQTFVADESGVLYAIAPGTYYR